MTSIDTFDVLTMTDDARNVVLDALSDEDAERLVGAVGRSDGHERRGLHLRPLLLRTRTWRPSDAPIGRDGDVTIVVPAASIDRLAAAVDSSLQSDGGGGLVLVNPNSPTPEEANPGLPAEILAYGIAGPTALVALDVLEDQVNPAIASHGGRADLVALDEEKKVAYIKLSGGCQGCAMSRMTLSQGIETMLKESIPELTGVLDVTDHASGENPFYSKE